MSKKIFISYKLFILLIAICMTNFFGFYKFLPLGSTLYSVDFMFVCVTAISFIIILACTMNKHGKTSLNIQYRGLAIALICLVLFEIPYTYLQYHQPISQALKEGLYYVIPLLCYFAYSQFSRRGGREKEIFNIVVKVSIVASAVAVIAFILYTYFGVNFLRLTDASKENFRFGTIRFGVGAAFVHLGLIISLSRILHKAHSKLDIINIILGSIQIIFVNKTRTIMLYFVVVLLLAIVTERKVKKFWKILLYIASLLCLITVFLFSDQISLNLTDYFNADAGIAMRYNTIKFYMEQFFRKPIFGMGFLSASKDLAGWNLRFGPAGYFYRDDVGIVGLINALGLFGLLWVVCFLLSLNKKRKHMDKMNSAIIRNMLIYFTITMINLSFMDNQRIMYVFWIMVFVDECCRTYKNQID